jgi:hypothetical protein
MERSVTPFDVSLFLFIQVLKIRLVQNQSKKIAAKTHIRDQDYCFNINFTL